MTAIYARWHMFEEKREAAMAIQAALFPGDLQYGFSFAYERAEDLANRLNLFLPPRAKDNPVRHQDLSVARGEDASL